MHPVNTKIKFCGECGQKVFSFQDYRHFGSSNEKCKKDKIKIDEKDKDKAFTILQEIEVSATLDDEGKSKECPKCGSVDLYTNFKSMRGPKGILSMLVMFFFVVFPFYFKNVYKCKNCGTEFK